MDSYKESLMPLMVDKMLAKGAVDGRNEIASVPSLFELDGAITTYTIFPHISSTLQTHPCNENSTDRNILEDSC